MPESRVVRRALMALTEGGTRYPEGSLLMDCHAYTLHDLEALAQRRATWNNLIHRLLWASWHCLMLPLEPMGPLCLPCIHRLASGTPLVLRASAQIIVIANLLFDGWKSKHSLQYRASRPLVDVGWYSVTYRLQSADLRSLATNHLHRSCVSMSDLRAVFGACRRTLIFIRSACVDMCAWVRVLYTHGLHCALMYSESDALKGQCAAVCYYTALIDLALVQLSII